MSEPLISIIIPVYNCENTIAVAIDSVLNQTYKNIEIIVVDDKSTDKTKEEVEKFITKSDRVKLVDAEEEDLNRFNTKMNSNVNAGYAARNIGFKYAKGEYITFQDADDASLLNRIEIQFNLLKKHNADHVVIDWIKYDDKYLNKQLDLENF
ncbi:glycosyltransferase family 2 protein [Candidatus Wolfebacteria bacterium]|nr:glycosyltransferase family 2 protein [Candidatus Wolfebacteria bacterium]